MTTTTIVTPAQAIKENPFVTEPTLPEGNAHSLYQYMMENYHEAICDQDNPYNTRSALVLVRWLTDYVISLTENRGMVDPDLDDQVNEMLLGIMILMNPAASSRAVEVS